MVRIGVLSQPLGTNSIIELVTVSEDAVEEQEDGEEIVSGNSPPIEEEDEDEAECYGSCVINEEGGSSKNEEFWESLAEKQLDYVSLNIPVFIRKLRAGSNLGEYTIVCELGSGTFGKVFKATDASGTEVAIKVQKTSDQSKVQPNIITSNVLLILYFRMKLN